MVYLVNAVLIAIVAFLLNWRSKVLCDRLATRMQSNFDRYLAFKDHVRKFEDQVNALDIRLSKVEEALGAACRQVLQRDKEYDYFNKRLSEIEMALAKPFLQLIRPKDYEKPEEIDVLTDEQDAKFRAALKNAGRAKGVAKCGVCEKEVVPGESWCEGHLPLANCDKIEVEDDEEEEVSSEY